MAAMTKVCKFMEWMFMDLKKRKEKRKHRLTDWLTIDLCCYLLREGGETLTLSSSYIFIKITASFWPVIASQNVGTEGHCINYKGAFFETRFNWQPFIAFMFLNLSHPKVEFTIRDTCITYCNPQLVYSVDVLALYLIVHYNISAVEAD